MLINLVSPAFPPKNGKSGPYCWVWEASSQFAINYCDSYNACGMRYLVIMWIVCLFN